jgi:hypothetical protein
VANKYIFEKRLPFAFDELGKLRELVDYHSTYASETPSAGGLALTYQLTCLGGLFYCGKNIRIIKKQ